MILLDTNILSALMRRQPEPTIVRWLDKQPSDEIWTTAISVFEIEMGLQRLDPGPRRSELHEAWQALLFVDLSARVQSFDQTSAAEAGRIAAERQASGQTVDFRDVEIAGIASARAASLATRNTRHFSDLGIKLIDPS